MGKNTLGTQGRYKEAYTGLLKKRESSGNCKSYSVILEVFYLNCSHFFASILLYFISSILNEPFLLYEKILSLQFLCETLTGS